MEDGNVSYNKDDKHGSPSLINSYSDLPPRITTNGHEFSTDAVNAREVNHNVNYERPQEEPFPRKINPLKIHLGKRPFVDNLQCNNSAAKRKNAFTNKLSAQNVLQRTPTPRIVPKLIPKKVNRNQYNVNKFHHADDPEEQKPVPRLVPKSQLSHYKKGKVEKHPQLKEYAQYLGLQPMVKFKCRKCCAMFKTLAILKEHQRVCLMKHEKEPSVSPDSALSTESNTDSSRVTRKVYLCSACGTYYENWNLFLHMREVHNRHICLFCLGMFSKAEKLSSHLTSKHSVLEYGYETKEEFTSIYNGTFYLMCCKCDEICTEKDEFFDHDCNNIKPKPVPMLVSKNTPRTTVTKQVNKNNNDLVTNGPKCKEVVNEKTKVDNRKEVTEGRHDPIPPMIIKNCSRSKSADRDSTNVNGTADITQKDFDFSPRLPGETEKRVSTPKLSPDFHGQFKISFKELDSRRDDMAHVTTEKLPSPINTSDVRNNDQHQPVEKEKEGGIKLKLSLNNAKSPVIINSTVDPTIGRNINKPPSRTRRPPKRYEKQNTVDFQPQPVLTPTIKMTICDKADSPFVKSTIIENKQDPTTSVQLNEIGTAIQPSDKSENLIKSTIYDNSPDEINVLNRVPKLTVRVPKELLDKESSSDSSSDSEDRDRLTMDERELDEIKEENDVSMEQETPVNQPEDESKEDSTQIEEQNITNNEIEHCETVVPANSTEADAPIDVVTEANSDKLIDEIPVIELSLDKPLDKYPLKDLLKVFLASTVYNCIYCNHVRKIAINCEQLSLHMVAQHKFTATVDSITAEELLPETITAKVKAGAEDLQTTYINMDSYDSVDKCDKITYDHVYECFQCYFKTVIHKDLYLHNRKMHQRNNILCVMCKRNCYSYSELLCHLCPGVYSPDNEYNTKFRCCLCNIDNIPSAFRLMVHLRKVHHTCDVCLEFCFNQNKLASHVWKHKLLHICYRCCINYRNKPDIKSHLIWKHGTESVVCKKCLQKKWPHDYHFCIPPPVFYCDECQLTFTKAVCLKVHKRLHAEEFPHVCKEEDCSEKFVSKKLLIKHEESHKTASVNESELKEQNITIDESLKKECKDSIPTIDLVNEKSLQDTDTTTKIETKDGTLSKKGRKKKSKDRDLLLDVDLPALNLSESDSSDESDGDQPPTVNNALQDIKTEGVTEKSEKDEVTEPLEDVKPDVKTSPIKLEESSEPPDSQNPNNQQVLDIWDNFKKYQAKIEKQKTPPLVPIRKHVCESDHDYCLVPVDINGDDSYKSPSKKKKKSPKKKHGEFSSSSSSSSSDSSCSCGSNCSCSSSSGSSSSSSSDSDSSDSGKETKKKKQYMKTLPNRRTSCASEKSAVDVMDVADAIEPTIAESDLMTTESETDEEFYDECPQRLVGLKLLAEKRNQLLLASIPPSEIGSEVSRSTTPAKDESLIKTDEHVNVENESEKETKVSSGRKKSKKKKKSKSTKKNPLKINIPKEIISSKIENEVPLTSSSPIVPNKITISLQSKTVQLSETPSPATPNTSTPNQQSDKRSSKRRRRPNKFYGYSSDEETPQQLAFKPQLPPKFKWRKEDLPSPVTHRTKKEVPSSTPVQQLYSSYTEPLRLVAPIPDPEPPRILMNTESMESSDSDSSNEGALEIYQPNLTRNPIPVPPPHLNSGTSSLPYAFVRPPVREAREGESVYCYCRCPYDEVSEMIACDADGCSIEWFHFECVGIMVPPKGKWYCPECRKKQNYPGFR